MCNNEKMLLLLSAHLDGCNTAEEEAQLQAHLAQCPDCRRILTEYEKINAGVADLTQAPPANFTANVMRAIQAEPRRAEPKKPRRFSFGFGTAAAAVAAILLLAIGAGKLPQLSAGSAKLSDAAMAESKEPWPTSAADEPAAEESVDEAPAAEAEPEPMEAPAEAAEAPEAAFSESMGDHHFPANVDCAALSRAENIAVGLLYADPADLPELKDAPSLPLDGGTRYEVTQESLDVLASRFDDLQVFEPEGYLPEEEDPAYLIVIDQ